MIIYIICTVIWYIYIYIFVDVGELSECCLEFRNKMPYWSWNDTTIIDFIFAPRRNYFFFCWSVQLLSLLVCRSNILFFFLFLLAVLLLCCGQYKWTKAKWNERSKWNETTNGANCKSRFVSNSIENFIFPLS